MRVVGERNRFERVYARHYEAVVRSCLRRAGREDGFDAAAETSSVAWRRREHMPRGAELPWPYGVARRVLSNQRRSARRGLTAAGRLRVVDADPADDPEFQVVRDQDGRAVAAAVARLRPVDQEVIRLAGWEELGRDEIAVAISALRRRPGNGRRPWCSPTASCCCTSGNPAPRSFIPRHTSTSTPNDRSHEIRTFEDAPTTGREGGSYRSTSTPIRTLRGRKSP